MTGTADLTEKEREALRLLTAGHDIKSTAAELDLSVHTITERLRNARRKLGVTSSREAARVLAQEEDATYRNDGDSFSGVHAAARTAQDDERRNPQGRGRPAIIIGGIVAMSLVLAIALFANPFAAQDAALTQDQPSVSTEASAAASLEAARSFVRAVDEGDYAASWDMSGTLFQSQLTAQQWAATFEPVREQVGDVRSRSFAKVTAATDLPGTPAGEYEIVEFRSEFSKRPEAVETVVLSKEGGVWKTVGYFIR